MINRVLPILLIVIAVGIGVIYIYPTYNNTITNEQQQINNYQSALAAATTFNQKESTLTTQYNAISPEDLARLQTYLPDGVDNIQLIVDLDALAARSGIILSGFQIQNSDASGTSDTSTESSSTDTSLQSTNSTNSLDLSVSATGTYDAFQAFLTSVEQSQRPLDVTQLSVKDSSSGVYTYSITFRIYWLQ